MAIHSLCGCSHIPQGKVVILEEQGLAGGTGSNIQNRVPAANLPILDKSLRHRRKISRCFSQNGAEALH
jgi:hypothetical protein